MKLVLFILLRIYEYAVFYLGLACIGMQCLTWSLVAVPLRLILPERIGRKVGRFMIMAVFRSFLGALSMSGRFRFELSELDALRNEKSLIIAPNHPSLWDAVLIVSRLPDVACVMKGQVLRNVFLGAGARLARYIRNDSPREMIVSAVRDVEGGDRLLLFPEGTRTVRRPFNPLKRSLGVIACRAHAPVQTVFIETDSPFLCKGWPLFKIPRLPLTYRVRLGRRFAPPADSAAFVAELEQYFESELDAPSAAAEGGVTNASRDRKMPRPEAVHASQIPVGGGLEQYFASEFTSPVIPANDPALRREAVSAGSVSVN